MTLQQVRSSPGLPSPRDTQTGEIIAFLSAIVTAAASIIASYAQLPWWFILAVGLLAVTIVSVLLKKFFWPVLREQISRAKETRRLDATSKAIFLDFEDLVRRFADFISTRTGDTLAGCIIELRNQDAWRSRLPAVPQLIFMSELFTPFRQRLQRWDGSYRQLNELAQEFWTFLHQHDITYVREPLGIIRSLKKEEVPDSIRNKINLLRENYAAFLRDYKSFAQRANSRLGLNPFVDFVNLPEPI